MLIELKRGKGTALSTEGRMYVDGEFECFTLEDADRHLERGKGGKVWGKTAIPRGEYQVEMRWSPHFNMNLPHIMNVPGFEYVMIHWGNYAEDTDGCILVGAVNSSMDDDFIGASKVAFNRLLPKIKSALSMNEPITLKIS